MLLLSLILGLIDFRDKMQDASAMFIVLLCLLSLKKYAFPFISFSEHDGSILKNVHNSVKHLHFG